MKKILIVDDSLFMRKVLKGIITDKKTKFKIIEASSGATALEMFAKEKPDLILLDIIMPESEEAGLKVLKNIMQSNPESKVVMVSAVGQQKVIEECKKFGAGDFITKPFEEDNVIKIIEKYLN